MKVLAPNAAWGWLGDVWAGGWGSSQLLGAAPRGLLLPCSRAVLSTSCACTHIHVPELLLALGSVGRDTYPNATDDGLYPARSSSIQGGHRNSPELPLFAFFCPCREKRVTEGKG